MLDPDAAGIEDAEIVLAVGDAAIGAFAKPLGNGTVVCRTVDAFGVEARLCMALPWPFSAAAR